MVTRGRTSKLAKLQVRRRELCAHALRARTYSSRGSAVESAAHKRATRSSCTRRFAARVWLFSPPLNAQWPSRHAALSSLIAYARSRAAPPGWQYVKSAATASRRGATHVVAKHRGRVDDVPINHQQAPRAVPREVYGPSERPDRARGIRLRVIVIKARVRIEPLGDGSVPPPHVLLRPRYILLARDAHPPCEAESVQEQDQPLAGVPLYLVQPGSEVVWERVLPRLSST